jgi:hypothetical protein
MFRKNREKRQNRWRKKEMKGRKMCIYSLLFTTLISVKRTVLYFCCTPVRNNLILSSVFRSIGNVNSQLYILYIISVTSYISYRWHLIHHIGDILYIISVTSYTSYRWHLIYHIGDILYIISVTSYTSYRWHLIHHIGDLSNRSTCRVTVSHITALTGYMRRRMRK